MSDSWELKSVTGVCTSITIENGWYGFSIKVDGWEHPLKLPTKLPELVEKAKHAAETKAVTEWQYQEKDGRENPNRPGTFYKDRRLSRVGPPPTQQEPSPSQPNPGTPAAAPSHVEYARPKSPDEQAHIARYGAVQAMAPALCDMVLVSDVADRAALSHRIYSEMGKLSVFLLTGKWIETSEQDGESSPPMSDDDIPF